MTIYFSVEEQAFFDDGVNDVLPADAKVIGREAHTAIMAGVAAGKRIDFSSGSPELVDAPPLTAEQLLEGVTLQRDALLSSAAQAMTPLLLSLQLGNATDAETTSAKAWQAYVRELRALDLTASAIAWPLLPS